MLLFLGFKMLRCKSAAASLGSAVSGVWAFDLKTSNSGLWFCVQVDLDHSIVLQVLVLEVDVDVLAVLAACLLLWDGSRNCFHKREHPPRLNQAAELEACCLEERLPAWPMKALS